MWDEIPYDCYEDLNEIEILINTIILCKTDKAVLIGYKNKQAWFPKSVLVTTGKKAIEYSTWFEPKWLINVMRKIDGDF